MIETKENIALIEKHLQGTLTSEEAKVFEAKLQQPEFVELVELTKLTHAVVVDAELITKRRSLDNFMSKKQKQHQFKKFAAVSILAALLVGSGLLFWMSDEGEKPKEKTPVEKELLEQTILPKPTDKKNEEKKKSYPPKESLEPATNASQKTVANAPLADTVTEDTEKKTLETDTLAANGKSYQEKTTKAVIDSCADFNPVLATKASCAYRPDGEIYFTQKPNDARLDIKGGTFTNLSLAPDVYEVEVFNASCSKTLYVEVETKTCLPEEEYAFSRTYDESITISLGDVKGRLTIFSQKLGQPVLTQMVSDETFRWEGKDDKGAFLPEGYYPVIIKTTNGEVIKTGITISP